MSLTSYRAAPPRAKRKPLGGLSRLLHREAVKRIAGANSRRRFVSCKGRTGTRSVSHPLIWCSAKQKGRFASGPWDRPGAVSFRVEKICCVLQTWQRPTLPRLETEYHWRRGVSRPCSEWERVRPPRNDHQVSEAQHLRSWLRRTSFLVFEHVFKPFET